MLGAQFLASVSLRSAVAKPMSIVSRLKAAATEKQASSGLATLG